MRIVTGARPMILAPRPGRYRLYRLGSLEAEAVLAEVGITRAELDRALSELERMEGMRVRSIVGINHDAVFGSSRAGWHPNLPDACKEPFVPLLWVKVHELLGRVPEGSTARFLQDGTLPDLAVRRSTLCRRGSCPAAISSKLAYHDACASSASAASSCGSCPAA